MNQIGNERRRFLKIGSLASASIAMALGAGHSRAQAARRVEENDAKALYLGYKHNASDVDTKQYPKYQSDQACANCTFYKGEPGEAFGPCQAFSLQQVSAKGWCVSYWKKA